MAALGGEFMFFQDIHVRIDIAIDISISLRPMTTKTGTSTGVDSIEINHEGVGDASHGKLKPLYLHYQRAYDYQTRQDGKLI